MAAYCKALQSEMDKSRTEFHTCFLLTKNGRVGQGARENEPCFSIPNCKKGATLESRE